MVTGLASCSSQSEGSGGPEHEASCKSICQFHAECEKTCFLDEEPDCDEQKNYDFIFGQCQPACSAGEPLLGGACAGAAAMLATCFEGKSCSAGLGDACRIDDMRYRELCLEKPGEHVCRNFSVELEIGCLPYGLFGFRGTGCEEACKASAADLECLEAHYALDECTEGMLFSCGAWSGECADEAGAVAEACEAWQPVEPEPEEQSFCAGIAEHQCDCGLFSGEECVTLAAGRCLFALGHGSDCRKSMESFDACMTGIESCDRDKLRDECLPQWDAWNEACHQ